MGERCLTDDLMGRGVQQRTETEEWGIDDQAPLKTPVAFPADSSPSQHYLLSN